MLEREKNNKRAEERSKILKINNNKRFSVARLFYDGGLSLTYSVARFVFIILYRSSSQRCHPRKNPGIVYNTDYRLATLRCWCWTEPFNNNKGENKVNFDFDLR